VTGYLYSNAKTRAAAVAFTALMSATPPDAGEAPSQAGPRKTDYTYYSGRYRAAQIPSVMPMASREDPPPPTSAGQTSIARAPQRAAGSAYSGLASPSRVDLSPPVIPSIIPSFARAAQRAARSAYDAGVVSHGQDVGTQNPVPTALAHIARGHRPQLANAAINTLPPPDPGTISYPQEGRNWVRGLVRIAAYALNVGPQYEASVVSQAGPFRRDYLYYRTGSPAYGVASKSPPLDVGRDPCVQLTSIPEIARGPARAAREAYKPIASPTPPDLGMEQILVADMESIPDRSPNTSQHPAYALIVRSPIDVGIQINLPPVKTIFPDFARGYQPRISLYAQQTPPPGEIAPPLPVVVAMPDVARSGIRTGVEAYRSLLSATPLDGSTMPTPVEWPDIARAAQRAGVEAYRVAYGNNVTPDAVPPPPIRMQLPDFARGPQWAGNQAYVGFYPSAPFDAGTLPVPVVYPDIAPSPQYRSAAYSLIVPAMPDFGIFQDAIVPPQYPDWIPRQYRTAAYELMVCCPQGANITSLTSPAPFQATWKSKIDPTKATFSNTGALLNSYLANPASVPWISTALLDDYEFTTGMMVLAANVEPDGTYVITVGSVDFVDYSLNPTIWLDQYELFCIVSPTTTVPAPFQAKWNYKR